MHLSIHRIVSAHAQTRSSRFPTCEWSVLTPEPEPKTTDNSLSLLYLYLLPRTLFFRRAVLRGVCLNQGTEKGDRVALNLRVTS